MVWVGGSKMNDEAMGEEAREECDGEATQARREVSTAGLCCRLSLTRRGKPRLLSTGSRPASFRSLTQISGGGGAYKGNAGHPALPLDSLSGTAEGDRQHPSSSEQTRWLHR